MILNTITLHNFMSYADAVLDFSSVSVACLSGPNGAGKSALLDAVTWVLWECARATSDELMRLGQKETWVDLCFTHEGQMYRVRRSRYKAASKSGIKSTSKGTLEFQVWNESDSSTGSLNVPISPAETMQRLAQTIRVAETGHSVESVALLAGSTDRAGITADFGDTAASAGEISAVSVGIAVLPEAVADHGRQAKSRRRAPKALAQAKPEDGLWRTLTGGKMSDTQKAITDLLRMDFDTFVNSAYLRQGRADEFTMKAAADRKQVLSDILGLSFFDEMQERARERARSLKSRQEFVESNIAVLGQTEAQIAQAELEVRQNAEQFGAFSQKVEAREQEAELLRQKILSLGILQEKLENGSKQLNSLLADVEELSHREKGLLSKQADLRALLQRSPEIEHSAREFERLKSASQDADRKAMQFQDLSSIRMELQTDLARNRSKLELDLAHAEELLAAGDERVRKLVAETADSERIEHSYARFKKLLEQESELSRKQEDFVRLTQRSHELQSIIAECRIRLDAETLQRQAAVADLQAVLNSRDVLETQRGLLQAEAEALERLEAEFELIEQRGMTAKTSAEATQSKIEELNRRQAENLAKVAELSCHADSSMCPLCAAPIVDRAAVIERYKYENESMDSEKSSLRHALADLENDRMQLRKQYQQIKQKLEARKQLDTEIGQFNERLNAVQRAQDSLSAMRDEHEFLLRRIDAQDYAQIERESLIGINAEILKLEFDPAQFATIQSQIRLERQIEGRYHQMVRDQQELRKVSEKLPEQKIRADELKLQLQTESYGTEVRDRLRSLQSEIDALGYDKQSHQDLKRQMAELLPVSEEFRDLQKSAAELPPVEEMLASCCSALAKKEDEIPTLKQDIERWTGELEDSSRWEIEFQSTQAHLSQLRAEREIFARSLAVSEAQMKQMNDRLCELTERKIELELIRAEIDDFLFLAEAFGKKGIQAVIIENAVPEIEAEANRILARLTDNKMHVAMVTRQRTKSGTVSETLDLLIGDEIGTRNYELYSGGEAFKINFAIRVALSRLLARRSGAKLETLIIDEGFGSQDDLSRDRLVTAIRSIQKEFARILVITHMPDVREMFPMQIQVSKVNGVSTVQMVC